jgi:hypothetical protein
VTWIIHGRRERELEYCKTPWYSSTDMILLTTDTDEPEYMDEVSLLFLVLVTVHVGR